MSSDYESNLRRLTLGGGHVIIGCRDKKYFSSGANVAKQELCAELKCSPDSISFIELDLSSIASIRKFCSTVLSDNEVLGKKFDHMIKLPAQFFIFRCTYMQCRSHVS